MLECVGSEGRVPCEDTEVGRPGGQQGKIGGALMGGESRGGERS